MIVDLRTVLHGPRQLDFTLEPSWWRCAEQNNQILGLASPFEVHISISKAGSRYLLNGRLSGRLRIRCDRCLEPYKRDLDSDFSLYLAADPLYTDQSEIELLEEDMSVEFITGDELCVDDIVREQVYLSLPMKCLCRTDCAGLCPYCGSNLNVKECGCTQRKGHPAFSKLKNITLKGA